MKNYYKFQVGSHTTTLLSNTSYFVFLFQIKLTENFVCLIFFFQQFPLEAKCLICFNRYHCKSISPEKKIPIIYKCIISHIMLSVLTVSIMGLITCLPISVFQILIIILSLSQHPVSYSLPEGICNLVYMLSAVIWVSVLLLAISKFSRSLFFILIFSSLIRLRVLSFPEIHVKIFNNELLIKSYILA